ncbi:MAG: hypothetical protein ACRENG_00560 [bacterium]
MMKSILFVAALLFLQGSVEAQSKLRCEVHGGLAFGIPTRNVFTNWENGWVFGLCLPVQINPNIQIVPSASYQRFRYTGQNPQLAFPAITGLRWKVEGERANLYETSLAMRFIAPGKFIKPFLALQGGAYFIEVGEIRVITWVQHNPQSASSYIYRGTGKSMTKGFYALGYGLNIPFNSGVAIQLEGRFTGTFDGNESFAYIISAVQFRL